MKHKDITEIVADNSHLLKNIFLTLISQLLITFLTVYTLRSYPNISEAFYSSVLVLIVFFLVMIVLIFLMLNYNIPVVYRFVLFCIFSILLGVSLSRLNKVNSNVLTGALFSTISVFVVMFIFGLLSVYYKFDLTSLGCILFFALIMLIISNIIFLLCGVSSTTYKIYIYIGIIIFSLYIMFDTYVVLKDKRKDFIIGALSYYLDIINLFVKFVSLGSRN
jgi:FtsH-binding integral membrane protein